MNDVSQPPPERIALTPKSPTPLCTMMSDGSLSINAAQIDPLELQRMLLSAAAQVSAEIYQRSMVAERMLSRIAQRFEGFDQETQQALEQLLSR